MVDIISKKCKATGCLKQPRYGFQGDRVPTFCTDHRPVEMVDITNKRCKEEACSKLPYFGFEGDKAPSFCATHRLPTMVHIKSKRCEKDKCTKQPRHGLPGHVATRCAQHKLPGMISKPRTRCKQPSCTHTATYGYRKAEFCEAHAPADSTNLVEHKCSSCGLIEILNSGNLCGNCDPKAAAARVRLSDQKTVKAFFDSEGLVYVSYDRQVEGGNCGRERPDFLFDAGTHFVVVEVDEHQHLFSGYSCHCEQVRMANITESLQLPTVFVRYNPDTYKPASGKVVSAKQRLVDLAKVVRAQIANRPECVCGVMYLFYDQHSAEDFTNIHVVS
jgi:hypothetical protein